MRQGKAELEPGLLATDLADYLVKKGSLSGGRITWWGRRSPGNHCGSQANSAAATQVGGGWRYNSLASL